MLLPVTKFPGVSNIWIPRDTGFLPTVSLTILFWPTQLYLNALNVQ